MKLLLCGCRDLSLRLPFSSLCLTPRFLRWVVLAAGSGLCQKARSAPRVSGEHPGPRRVGDRRGGGLADVKSQQGHAGGGGQGYLCPEDVLSSSGSLLSLLCTQRGALLEAAELLGRAPIGGLGFGRGVMLGNGGQH